MTPASAPARFSPVDAFLGEHPMPWTCQPDAQGPLWWPLTCADHWYKSETEPERLAADYLDAHPEHRDRTLTLKWWTNWSSADIQLQIEPDQVREFSTA